MRNKKGSKSITPTKENNLNMTTIEADILPQSSLKTKNSLIGTLLNDTLKEKAKNSFTEKIFKGDLSQKSSKNANILQEFLWEYAIIFPNPDYPGQENRAVTELEAHKFYKHCFKAKKTGSTQKDTLNFLQEAQSFTKIFQSLKDFENGKSLTQGGRFTINEGNVFDCGKQVQDFMSLVRNAVFFKLVASLSLKVKQMVSKTGEYIFFVITADEGDLQIEAERTRFNKQLEIALTDIQSLIPCDASLRPLHILKNDDEEIRRLFKDIKPFLTKAFGLEKNTEKIDYKQDPDGVTQNMWNAYKIYLTLLKEGISKITSSVSSHKAQMFLFQKLVKDSIEKANVGFRPEDRLKNLWEKMNILKPIPPYAEYRRSNGDDEFGNLWRSHEIDESGKRSLFRSMERLRLIVSYIETEIGINYLQEHGIIVAHFPLHNIWQLKGKDTGVVNDVPQEDLLLRNILYDFKSNAVDGPLMQSWKTALINQRIPLSKIRNYYGEKIALYFEFLRYYQCSLLFPALIGLIVFVIQRVYDQDSSPVLALNAIYSVFMTIWATVFLEGWRRKESSLSILWGTTKFERVEVPRPQYKGVTRRSPITDEMEEIYYPTSKRVWIFIASASVSLLILSLVLGIVAGLIILKSEITDSLVVSGINFAGPVVSIINAVQIIVFNVLYGKLAKIMTNMENHKTENQYQDSYILKVFAFQFVNAFNSLCYIAFIKGYTEKCIATDDDGKIYRTTNCMNELYTQLISIFIVSYIKNLIEIGVPYTKFQMKKRKKIKNKQGKATINKDVRDKVEAQLYLEYYVTTDRDGTIDDYMELAIQFGYLTLFALAFPLSTSLAFIGLWFEMHTDKLKVLHLIRRPIPLSSRDIGTWFNIFSVICVFAIFSNTALFCFTSRTFERIDGMKDNAYIVFAIVVIILLIFRSQLQSWIPDVPESYEIVQARHDYIVEKVLRGEAKPLATADEEVFDCNMYFANSSGEVKQTELDF
jgi:hypothetical protein